MTIEHTDIQTGEQHVVANWVLSSILQLPALTTLATDIGKQAWVAGRGHYVLAATDPNVWELVAPTVASLAFAVDTDTLTVTLTDATSFTATIPLGTTVAEANALIAAALTDYYTAAQIDTIVSGIGTALSGKEPSIAAGTTSQYWRGDKTWQTLDADAVAATASRVYLSPAQKTVATQAATSMLNGYLSSTDWATFNSKQAALGDVITANTYGSSTQYPKLTVNAKGIVTGITLQTVPTPTFTDATFAVQKNGSPSISATWSLTAFTASHVHTYPDKDINFGTMSSVATTDGNTLSGTRTRIVGGSNNTVSGTDNIVIGSDNLNISSSQVGLNARGMRHKVRGATAITLPAGSLIDGMQSGTIGTSTFAGGCKITSYLKIHKAADIQNTIVADSSGIKPLANIGKNEFEAQCVAVHKLTVTSAFGTQATEWLIVVRESGLPVVLAKGGIGSHLPTITATASSAGSGDSILRELTITIASTAGTIANAIQWNVFLESYYTATEPLA